MDRTPPKALPSRLSDRAAFPKFLRPQYAPPAAPFDLGFDPADEFQPIRRIGFYLCLAFTFVRFTGLHEVLTMKLGFNTYILYVLGVLAGGALILSGGIPRTLRWTPARLWLGFAIWLVVAVPFSYWIGGSIGVVLTYFRTELIQLFLLAGLVLTWSEVWVLFKVLAAATATNVVLGYVYHDSVLDRMQLEFGNMSNANDFAAQLMLMIPFLVLVALTPGRAVVLRIAAAAVTMVALYQVLATGSRGALIALLVTLIVALILAKREARIVLIVFAVLFSIVATALLPDLVVNRLSTLFYSEEDRPDLDTHALGSSMTRTYLLKQSIIFTLRHPLFGVGPGQFSDYEGTTVRASGQRGAWQQTHNAYTQVSSEAGIPAFVFYVAALVTSFGLLRRTYKEARQQPVTDRNRKIVLIAGCLMVSMASFGAAIFFLSLAYRFYFPALTGLTIALYRAVQYEYIKDRSQPIAIRSTVAAPAARFVPKLALTSKGKPMSL